MDRPYRLSRTSQLLVVGFAALALFFAVGVARANADVYCVSTSNQAGCSTFSTNLQSQLNAAAVNPGHDEVWIFPGSYTGNFSYSDSTSGNTVDITGKGATPQDTVITLASTLGVKVGLDVHAAPGSTISNLKVTVPANADVNGDQGLNVFGTNAGDVTINNVAVDGPNSQNATGIWCGYCTIRDSVIDMSQTSGPDNFAVREDTGPAHVEGSTLISEEGFSHSSPGVRSTIENSRITARTGATTDGGFIDISNSLIRLDDGSGAIGVNFHNSNNGTSEMGGDMDGVTIINGVDNDGNPSPGYSTGIVADADSPLEKVTVNLANSVISGFSNFPYGRTLDLGVNQGGVLNFDASYSAYNNGLTAQTWDGDGSNFHYTLGDGHIDLENGPGYVDPASGDYTPGPSSDLLDAGNPADPDSGTTDIDGNPRACHGTSDGVIRRDIGAFEYRTKVGADLDDCTYPDTTITDGPEAYPPAMYTSDKTQFTLGSTKVGSTFLCSIDGGAYATCSSPYTSPALDEGVHTFSFKAVDSFGNIDQSPVERDVYLGAKKGHPPTCKEDPSVCPNDTTPPKVTGVKAPKKTKLARIKVRFKSNEKGSTFKCRLNKGKWKSCKSPWKTPKLRKGKNTISIQATDKAGNKSKVAKRVVKRVAKKKKGRG